MIWVFFLIVAVLVAGGFAALILGRANYDAMPPATHTEHDVGAAHLTRAADIDHLHFDTALRGYRMDQVDEVLDALQAKLAAYEAGDAAETMKLPRTVVRPRPGAAELATPRRASGQAADPGPDDQPARAKPVRSAGVSAETRSDAEAAGQEPLTPDGHPS